MILGPKMVQVTAVWGRKKISLTRDSTTCTADYCEDDRIREDHMGGRANVYRGLVGES